MKYGDFMEAGLKTIRFEIGGFSIEEAAAACHTSARTYKKWETTKNHPTWAKSILLCKAGILQDKGFQGWRIYEGKLISPEGYEFSSGEIRSIIYQYALIAELENQLRSKDQFGKVDDCYNNVIIFPRNKKRDSI